MPAVILLYSHVLGLIRMTGSVAVLTGGVRDLFAQHLPCSQPFLYQPLRPVTGGGEVFLQIVSFLAYLSTNTKINPQFFGGYRDIFYFCSQESKTLR